MTTTNDGTKAHVWLEWCAACKRRHRVTLQPCPACNGRSGEWVPQPVSARVGDRCPTTHLCSGCDAYRGHLW
jgi:hypothetical protein